MWFKKQSSPSWQGRLVAGQWGSWVHCAYTRKQRERELCAQLTFPFYSVWDSSPWNGALTLWIGLPTMIDQFRNSLTDKPRGRLLGDHRLCQFGNLYQQPKSVGVPEGSQTP